MTKQGDILKRLIRDYPMRQEDFAYKIGVSRTYLISLFKYDLLPEKYIEKACEILNIKRELFTNVNNNDPSANLFAMNHNRMPVVVVDISNEEVISTVPITAKAGYIRRYNDPEFIEDLPISILPEKKFRGLTTRAFQVEGVSMENTIKDKSWIYGTFVEQGHWELIKNHLVYILHVDDDIIIKRIHNKIKEAGIIVAYSDNSDFEPQVIEASEIRQIWKARRKLDGDFAKKIKVTQRIDDDLNDDDDLY